MDASKLKANPNPRQKASIISVLLWWWTIDLFKKGYKKVLGTEDLYDPITTDRSSVLGDRLEAKWNVELENSRKYKRRPSLLKTIFYAFIWEYFLLGLLHIVNEFILRLGTPILLGGLLRYFKLNSTVSFESAVWCASGIILATVVTVIFLNQAIYMGFHIGGRIRIGVCSVIYRKALRLSKTALGETAPGKIVNLLANDVNRFDLVSIFLHHLWSAPLSAVIITYVLYTEAKYAGLIGIAAVFTVVPIQTYTGKLTSKFRLRTAIKTDERVRLMNEIISGVQVIKMYAWEKPFCALVELARKLELNVVTKSSYLRGIYMTFNIFTTRMALYCTLVSMVMFGSELTADKVFVFSSYFNILAHTMSGMFVRGIAETAECLVAVRRLQYFLMYEEFQGRNVLNCQLSNSNGTVNGESKHNSAKSSKQNLPYIDDDVNDAIDDDDDDDDTKNDINNGDNDKRRKQNGLVTVANDLLKNTVELVERKDDAENKRPWGINLDNVTAKWRPEQSENTLEKLDLEMESEKLYAVIGMVGAGKSSLLSAILGEISLVEGDIKVKGTLSYASQESWVFGASVRQNILFGQPYERRRYQQVVKACALLRDFKQFPQGDQTIVGDRGSSLSGGQKARINLARAIYKRADVYLLDDPLSAVDAHVGKHLFEECIQKYLAGKTRILVTHQLEFIKGVDGIVLLEQGRMYLFSNYHELLRSRPDYAKLLATEGKGETTDDSSNEITGMRRQFSTSSNRSRTPDVSGGDTDAEDETDDPANLDELMEGTSRGVIKGSIFLKYFQAGTNLFIVILVLLLFIFTQAAASLNDFFVSVWVNAEEARHRYSKANKVIDIVENSTVIDSTNILSTNMYIYIYTVIVIFIFGFGITRSLTFYKLCMRSSQRLHDLMFGALIRSSMRFFDVNPSGRILNRFSKDMGAIDELLPKAILDAGQVILLMFGSLIVSCTINPIFLVPILFLSTVFYWIRKIYLKTSKNVKRLEGVTRSPVFTHINATLDGLTTIRAYGAQDILKQEFDKFQDVHTSSWYMFIVTSSAFGFSLDIFCLIFITLIIISFLLLNGRFTGGEVGLAITQVMAMTGMIQWGMRQSAEVTNQMMSVERVLEYTQLPPESHLRDKGIVGKKGKQELTLSLTSPPKNWPSDGRIKFKNVYLRYSEDDSYVLKGLNFEVHSNEKIGIVGRTGAGKSSLIAALFRLTDIEGVIEIDGIDTGSIYLEDLRRRISIIPQDPVLFSGTLRSNLDPFDEFSDRILWEVLEEVELKESVTINGNGLESRVFNGGSNYSVGQRQLVCLARAILRNNRILMLDEATANVDPQTDALIQHTIRTKFSSCTVLTVAHRLNTIMDSDKVLIMDKGRLKEFEHPYLLLQNEYSQFTSMVKETGRAMRDQLFKTAKQSYELKHGSS